MRASSRPIPASNTSCRVTTPVFENAGLPASPCSTSACGTSDSSGDRRQDDRRRADHRPRVGADRLEGAVQDLPDAERAQRHHAGGRPGRAAPRRAGALPRTVAAPIPSRSWAAAAPRRGSARAAPRARPPAVPSSPQPSSHPDGRSMLAARPQCFTLAPAPADPRAMSPCGHEGTCAGGRRRHRAGRDARDRPARRGVRHLVLRRRFARPRGLPVEPARPGAARRHAARAATASRSAGRSAPSPACRSSC